MSNRGLAGGFIAICISVFFVMLGVGIVSPILPLYAESFEVSYSVVGFAVSAFGLARMVSDVPAGSLTDRFGRKPIILFGAGIFSIAGLIAAYAENIYHLIVSRFVQGVGAALLTTTAMALVGDLAPTHERGRYMGYYQGAFFLGTAAGPAVGGFLLEYGGFRMPFLALSILSAIGGLYAYLEVRESLRRSGRRSRPAREVLLVVKESLSHSGTLTMMLAALTVFATTSGVRLTALPIYGEKEAHLPPGQIGSILSIAALFNLLVIARAGSMIDRFGSQRMLSLGFLATGVTVLVFAYTQDFAAMAFIAAIYGLATGLIFPAQATAVIEAADPDHRGLFVGIYRVFGDLGIILGPIISGVSADRLGLASPFLVMAGISVASGIGIWLQNRRKV